MKIAAVLTGMTLALAGCGGDQTLSASDVKDIAAMTPTAEMPKGTASYEGNFDAGYKDSKESYNFVADLTLDADFDSGKVDAELANIVASGTSEAKEDYELKTSGTTKGSGTLDGNSLSVTTIGTLTLDSITVDGKSVTEYNEAKTGNKEEFQLGFSGKFVGDDAAAFYGKDVDTDDDGGTWTTIVAAQKK